MILLYFASKCITHKLELNISCSFPFLLLLLFVCTRLSPTQYFMPWDMLHTGSATCATQPYSNHTYPAALCISEILKQSQHRIHIDSKSTKLRWAQTIMNRTWTLIGYEARCAWIPVASTVPGRVSSAFLWRNRKESSFKNKRISNSTKTVNWPRLVTD